LRLKYALPDRFLPFSGPPQRIRSSLAKKMQPRSLEEIEMLEEKLRQALDELARQKKELPAKGTTGGAAEKKNQKGEKKS